MKNKGFNLTKELASQSEQDYIFGAFALPDLAIIPIDEREQCLPVGELQRTSEDMMDCATRAAINILETKFNWLLKNQKLSADNVSWLAENGYVVGGGRVEFSDAFTAINSGTTREGNSLKAPLDSIRKQGIIPKKTLPLERWMTFNTYHDPDRITQAMRLLGAEFVRRFYINYEKVLEKDYPVIAKKDLINVAGYAWMPPMNGIYPTSDNAPNHAFMTIRPQYYIFDNYLDNSDAVPDFIKRLAPDYTFLEYGYRITMNENAISPQKRGLFSIIGHAVQRWFAMLY